MSSFIERQSGTVTTQPADQKNNNQPLMSQDRRNDYDVTNRVQVSSPGAVRDAVHALYAQTYPDVPFDKLWLAFHDFERLFRGDYPGYFGCDTTYHDMQHTLDMTLALVRLIVGYEKSSGRADQLGAERAQMAIITSLFHDSGYIRHRVRDKEFKNGAEFTMQHVSRSADFLRRYLPTLGMADDAAVSSMIVHFTGYELGLDEIELDDQRDLICGHLIGTADLIAQMADRCYLEKCRDRLYKEFVIGGVAIDSASDGEYAINYESGIDLLKKTPGFYQQVTRDRLQNSFNRAYRYVEVLYDGENPYTQAIKKNIEHLVRILKENDWRLLRRNPPCFVSGEETVSEIDNLVRTQLEAISLDPEYAPSLATA